MRELGADVIELPTIRIEPPSNLREFAELVQDAHSYDWIVFTSVNGVDAFFEIFFKLYDDAREIGAAKIAAIGPVTAQRVKEFHFHVDLQPAEFVAEEVIKEFQNAGGVETGVGPTVTKSTNAGGTIVMLKEYACAIAGIEQLGLD